MIGYIVGALMLMSIVLGTFGPKVMQAFVPAAGTAKQLEVLDQLRQLAPQLALNGFGSTFPTPGRWTCSTGAAGAGLWSCVPAFAVSTSLAPSEYVICPYWQGYRSFPGSDAASGQPKTPLWTGYGRGYPGFSGLQAPYDTRGATIRMRASLRIIHRGADKKFSTNCQTTSASVAGDDIELDLQSTNIAAIRTGAGYKAPVDDISTVASPQLNDVRLERSSNMLKIYTSSGWQPLAPGEAPAPASAPYSPTSCRTAGYIPVAATTLADGSIEPGFCVSKFEGGFAGSPDTAENLCKAQQGKALISGRQWMAIANQAAQDSRNWTSGVVGQGALIRGHSDGAAAAPVGGDNILTNQPADADGYNGTGNASPSDQRRTLYLSNGQVIWDFSGNRAEWTTERFLRAAAPIAFADGPDYTANAFQAGVAGAPDKTLCRYFTPGDFYVGCAQGPAGTALTLQGLLPAYARPTAVPAGDTYAMNLGVLKRASLAASTTYLDYGALRGGRLTSQTLGRLGGVFELELLKYYSSAAGSYAAGANQDYGYRCVETY
ncbi:hypothetical protein [Ramlibacter alkalitolerans]|uniref:Uncharacterized protein n=1 Tax=Ramlibacter alkalitolerans TaxID=2039631 RepID=A0ABS1JTZ5_9BURK|nr:hypothetical protein [Ramlibacter alkalitolerans]MBL0427760.1 hypothetical protein [Ramlibacter alkalitolerans]